MPTIAVVTNIDPEHLDYYRGIEEIKEAFLSFVNKIPFFGLAVLCLDHPNIQSLIPRLKKRFTTYGLTTQADFQAKEIVFEGLSTSFDVLHQRKEMGRLKIQMPGLHNVYNALATVATAFELDIPFQNGAGDAARFRRDSEAISDQGREAREFSSSMTMAIIPWRSWPRSGRRERVGREGSSRSFSPIGIREPRPCSRIF